MLSSQKLLATRVVGRRLIGRASPSYAIITRTFKHYPYIVVEPVYTATTTTTTKTLLSSSSSSLSPFSKHDVKLHSNHHHNHRHHNTAAIIPSHQLRRITTTTTTKADNNRDAKAEEEEKYERVVNSHAKNAAQKEKVSQDEEGEEEYEEATPRNAGIRGTIKNKLKAYSELMRLEKPIGTYLLLFPCLWSMSMADQFSVIPDPVLALSFTVGALVMRGAGCTVNDLWDRKIDAQVERTRERPIPSGRVSVPEALLFLGAQLSAGAWILFSQFNVDTIIACTASLALVGLYPLMKRITNWPQAFLGLTFNWGALVGFLAVSGAEFYNPLVTVPLYLAGISWTLVYDTLYAHQDKTDDRKVGVKSTALLFGDGKRGKAIMAAFAVLFAICMILAGYYGARYDFFRNSPYYLSILLSTSHMFYQIYSVNLNNPAQCGQMFRSNRFIGVAILFGIIASNFLKQMDAIQFDQERKQLIEEGYDPDLVPQDEEVNRARAMYRKLAESRQLSIMEKLTLVLDKLSLK